MVDFLTEQPIQPVGSNPELSVTELSIANAIKRVWKKQRDAILTEMIKNIELRIVTKLDEEGVLHFVSMVEELQLATRELIRTEFVKGGNEALKEINIEPIGWINNQNVDHWLDVNVLRFVLEIDQVVHDDLTATLRQGISFGETIPQLRERVKDVFEDYEQFFRAETIARTESARALIGGKIESWKQSGIVSAKVWDAVNDSCPFCLDMDGKVVELDKNFFEQGDSQAVKLEGGKVVSLNFDYAEVPGPPLHPNCRCSLRAKLVEVD